MLSHSGVTTHPIEDLDKIIHYCELEKKKLKDTKKKKK